MSLSHSVRKMDTEIIIKSAREHDQELTWSRVRDGLSGGAMFTVKS